MTGRTCFHFGRDAHSGEGWTMMRLIGFVSFSRTTVLAPMSEAAKFATRRRPLWPFPMILPLPDGPMDASGGQASNQARLGISTALRADQAELSVG